MELFLSICLGVGLAAACGFRVFVPLFFLSALEYAGIQTIGLTEGFEWIGGLPALITFGAASLLEIGAYYIPFVDNLLDTIAVPLAAVAGTLVSLSTMVDLEPLMRWSFALIAGGGLAGLIKGSGAGVRAASSATTAGVGNPVISTAETGAAFGLSALAIFIPVLALVFVVLILFWIYRGIRRVGKWWFKKRPVSSGLSTME